MIGVLIRRKKEGERGERKKGRGGRKRGYAMALDRGQGYKHTVLMASSSYKRQGNRSLPAGLQKGHILQTLRYGPTETDVWISDLRTTGR